MERLLALMTVFSLALIVVVFASLRRERIRVEYSVAWLTAGFTLLMLSLNSSLVHWLAVQMGVDYPPLALVILVLLVFLVVFYRFSRRISDLKDANVALAQRLAMLEYKLERHGR